MTDINIKRTQNSRINEVDWNNLGFGKIASDHIFVTDFIGGEWRDYRIEPYGPMPINPGNCTLHYGQTIFEGLKAFRTQAGHFNIFRPEMNGARMNRSAVRMCIPEFPVEHFVEAVKKIVEVDHEWVPRERGTSLYLRPFSFGTDDFLGVRPSQTYKLIIMTSPVAAYYEEGLNPVRIKVATEYIRAAKGGTGSAKTAANYAASMKAAQEAKKEGFAQVLWLDGITREFVDEVGTMNIMFVIGDELITPPLDDGTILAGVTRDSVLTLAREFGMNVREHRLTIGDVTSAFENGTLTEIFGTGTAAVISPVGELVYGDRVMRINDSKIGPVAQKFYDTITGIQYGEIEDTHNWIVQVNADEMAHA
ncbi:MAG: branched chain amino acid aminotransferase [Ectothiorhodospiraceae bacterium]|nr:branched chain amino acid aminotransferase [Ectothiorhodospiraceae bacterium]